MPRQRDSSAKSLERGRAAFAALPDDPAERAMHAPRVLLDLDRGARLLELRLDRVGLLAGDALLDGLRCAVDEVLRLLQPEAGDRADDLDHADLLLARRGQDDVERRLLLGGGPAVGARRRTRSGDRDRRS